MANILSQFFGIVFFVFVFASMQTTDMKKTLFCQICCNVFGMLSYVFLGGLSGCGIYLVAAIQSLVLLLYRRSDKEVPKWVTALFFAAYLACSLLTFRGAKDIVPLIAAILCAVALIQKKTSHYRLVILLNGAMWILYDLFMGAYTMLASHIFTVASALSGIIRLDILKKNK